MFAFGCRHRKKMHRIIIGDKIRKNEQKKGES